MFLNNPRTNDEERDRAGLHNIFFYKNIFHYILWDIYNPKDSCKNPERYCNYIEGNDT